MRLSRCSLRAHNSLPFLLLYFRIFKLLYIQYLIFKITLWGSWASLVSKFSSVQSLSHVWLCNPMDRPPCPSPTPGVYPSGCTQRPHQGEGRQWPCDSKGQCTQNDVNEIKLLKLRGNDDSFEPLGTSKYTWDQFVEDQEEIVMI